MLSDRRAAGTTDRRGLGVIVREQDLVGLYGLFSRRQFKSFVDNFASTATYRNMSADIEASGRDDIVTLLEAWPTRFANLRVTGIRAEGHANRKRVNQVPEADSLWLVNYRLSGRYVSPFPRLARMNLPPAKDKIVELKCGDFVWMTWARQVLQVHCFMDTSQLFVQK